ncbi:MAG: sporulation protein YqfD [Ruminococcus sp.]|nr:sporulation protein YqfD [Ruminococcus sp.]
MRGYVRFTVSGRYPERFLNITSRNRVRLWDVKRQEDGFAAYMYRSDYRSIRPLARGAGVRLRVSGKMGFPALLYRYRARAGVIIGVCAFILAVFVMSLFIWSVDITGLETIGESEMRSVLREQGLYVGAFKPSLDAQQIARDILLERHEIGWMAVNITGSYASVEVKEEAPAPKVEDVYTPCNIKAKSDGQIIRIEAMEGETVLTEGSGVIEGQLVVSGVMGSEQSGSRLVHAQARVIARTAREADFSVPAVIASLAPTGESAERKSVDLFSMSVPYRFAAVDSPYSICDRITDSPAALDITLPVGVVTETVHALTPVETALDDDSAEELLQREASLYEAFSLQGCTVEERICRLTRSGDIFTLHVTYTCVEDIAYTEPIYVSE